MCNGECGGASVDRCEGGENQQPAGRDDESTRPELATLPLLAILKKLTILYPTLKKLTLFPS